MDHPRIIEAGRANNMSEFTSLFAGVVNEMDALAHIKHVGRQILAHHARNNNHVKFEPVLRYMISIIITLIEKSSDYSIVVHIGVLNSIIIYEDNYYPEFLSIINEEMYKFLCNKYTEVDTLRYLVDSVHHEVYALANIRETNAPLLAMNNVLYGLPYGSYSNMRELMAMPDKEFLPHLLSKIDIIHESQRRKDKHKYSCDVRKNELV